MDPDSYQDSGKAGSEALQGSPHPIAWYRERAVDLGNNTDTNGMNATNGTTVQQGSFVANGRMWYTALGHTIEIWQDPTFQAHIKGGIDWVLETESSVTPSNSTGVPAAGVAASQPTSSAPSSSAGGASGTSAKVVLSLCICTILAAFMQGTF